jgi:deazaflavin-dependent oxidoreductase (nitroreductase family)
MAENRAQASTPWFIKNVMNPLFTLSGAFPILAVRGRRSGKLYKTPVNVVELDGMRYVVSPRGETGWSRNLRVVGECSLKVKGDERQYHGSEVPPAERQPIIAAYLEHYGDRTHGQFEALPDPADHPTFRLEPV